MRQSTAAVTARPGQIDKTRTGNHPGQAGDPDPWSIPLEQIDVSDATLFARNAHGPYFARLRDEDPVHYTPQSAFGPYWSVTRFEDIKYVDTHHDDFSSQPSIVIGDPREDFTMPMFIAMDRPKHTQQRRGVTEAVSPTSLAQLEPTLRRRVGAILDSLPVGEEFDWVKAVSIELTTQMLATLLEFPFEDRHRLTHWSDCAASTPQVGATAVTEEYRRQVLMECLEYFSGLWVERTRNPGNDFVSMMAHSAAYQDMQPLEYLGNLVLLIVAGNDTTRNSISGGVYALNQFPAEYRKLRSDTGLIPNMVAEIIRWQMPLSHMRRTAKVDVSLAGKKIRAGDKVVMWYASGNRDERMFEQPDSFIIDRPNARQHMAFGFGIHRCMGTRLATMQLRVLWEEMLARFRDIEVMQEPQRVCSNFVNGYQTLPVRLHAV